MPKQPKRARPAPIKSRAIQIDEPIFSGQASNIIPGEVILKLRNDTAAQITESVPTGPTRGHSAPGPSAMGITALDTVLSELRASSITRLHPPASTMTATSESAVVVASTFRVRFEVKTEPQAAANQLNNVEGVEYAEPNRYRETSVTTPNDPSFPNQWGLTKINCPAAWDRTTGSPNVVAAIIDTGVDLDHPELAPLLVPGQDLVDLGPNPTPPPGFHFEGDFMGRDNDPQDEVGHGTHVAGTIACSTNNNSGVAGVTWTCHVMPVRVLARIVNNANATDVRGVGSAADIAAGIRWAVDHGARVLNLSLGGPVDTQVERDAIAYAIAQGAVVVAAMGNGFQQGNATSFPAAYPDVVAVGAITQADQRAAFSQTGPHIDVAAPGVGILSTVWDNGFATMSGTSMATPHVSGVACLILSCNPNLTGPQVADILRQTARPLRDNAADPVPNDNYGHGCVDAQAALQRACPQPVSRPIVTCPAPSTQLRCPPSRPVFTCPSVITCPPTRPVITCPPPSRLACPSRPIVACPSALVCPSRPIITCPRPSLPIPCPSGPVCGIERPPVGGAGGFGAEGYGFDPYGYGAEEWAEYDPYAYWYGGEDDPNNT
jgi:Subtilase family/N-terminal of Subtilase family